MATTVQAPPADFLLRNLARFRNDPLGFAMRTAREHGPIARFHLGPQLVFLVSDPEWIKDVLVTNGKKFMKGRGLQRAKRLLGDGLLTSEFEYHRRQRRLAQPAFHRDRINAYGTVMVDYAAQAAARWKDDTPLDVAVDMMQLTLRIVGKTLFDSEVEDEAPEIGKALTDAMELFFSATLPFSDLLYRLPLPMTKRFEKAKARLDETIYRIIKERRASEEDRGDLLSMLLMAQDTEGDGGGMTDEQLRDEALTIFLAGHETTANALTWTWYLLGEHPEVEARMHAELASVLGTSDLGGRLPTVEDLPNLVYTRMVLAESMRCYPPAWMMGRLAIEDHEIGGFPVPKDTLVLMSQFVVHNSERFYPDPVRFDPERWTPEAKALRPLFSYFPFGGGQRVCIGESFAWMEGILLIAAIAQRWKLRLVADHPVSMQPLVTLRPLHGMKMIPHPR